MAFKVWHWEPYVQSSRLHCLYIRLKLNPGSLRFALIKRFPQLSGVARVVIRQYEGLKMLCGPASPHSCNGQVRYVYMDTTVRGAEP